MIYNVEFSNFATKDFDKTIDYISDTLKNPYAAFQLGNIAESTINSLALFPYKHQLVQDSYLSLYQIRYVKVKNYLVIYTVSEENRLVYIVRFLYSRSNWKNILRKSIQYDEHLSETTGGYVHEEQEEYGKQFKKEKPSIPETPTATNSYDNLDEETARQELINELQKGLDDIKAGRVYSEEEVFAMLDEMFKENEKK